MISGNGFGGKKGIVSANGALPLRLLSLLLSLLLILASMAYCQDQAALPSITSTSAISPEAEENFSGLESPTERTKFIKEG